MAVEQMKRLGVAVARHKGSDERVATRQLFQRLSLTLMRGNAALVTSRRPDDDFAAPITYCTIYDVIHILSLPQITDKGQCQRWCRGFVLFVWVL